MNNISLLRPPLYWAGQKPGVQEDLRYQRWSALQIRAMKNGTYDWSKHVEKARIGKD